MTDKEIRKILEQYEESDCQNYDEGRLVEFAKAIYNKALEDAAEGAKVTQDALPDDSPPYYYVDKNSILKLKI